MSARTTTSCMARTVWFFVAWLVFALSVPLGQAREHSASATAFTGSITGTVHSTTGRPLADSAVRFAGTTVGTHTDGAGRFRLTRIPSATPILVITHLGHETLTRSLTLDRDRPILDLGVIVLPAAPEPLASAVYTASRSALDDDALPLSASTVSGANLRMSQAQSTAEVLREVPGIHIQKTSHGGGHAIMRGLTSNRVLLLVDGIRLNNSTYRLGNHPYLTFVDPLALGRMEVVRGPGSVLYGSDALGGTINLITRAAAFSDSGTTVRGGATLRAGSADDQRLGHARAAMAGSRWSLFLAGGIDRIGDLRRGENGPAVLVDDPPVVQTPTGFDIRHAMGTFRWQPRSGLLLTLSHQRTHRPEVPRYDKYLDGDHRWLYTDQRRELSYLRADLRVGQRWLRSLHATVSLNRQTEGRSTQDTPHAVRTEESDDTRTIGVDLSGEWRSGRFQGAYGVDIYQDLVASEREFVAADGGVTRDSRGRYPDEARYTSVGVFTRQEMRVAERWRVQAGLRYSRFAVAFDTSPGLPYRRVDDVVDAITGSLGARVDLAAGWSAHAALAQGFRAPNLGDLARLGESRGSTFDVPNPDLGPESLLSLEVGSRVAMRAIELELSAYHGWLRDTIERVPATWLGSAQIVIEGETYDVRRRENTGDARLMGVELAGSAAVTPGITLRGTVSWAWGENSSTGEPFDGIPPLTGYTGLIGDLPWADLSVEPFVRFAGEQRRLSPDDLDDPRIPAGGSAAWWTANLRARARLNDHVAVAVALHNLLDLNYRVHGSGINAPGRSAVATLELTSGGHTL